MMASVDAFWTQIYIWTGVGFIFVYALLGFTIWVAWKVFSGD